MMFLVMRIQVVGSLVQLIERRVWREAHWLRRRPPRMTCTRCIVVESYSMPIAFGRARGCAPRRLRPPAAHCRPAYHSNLEQIATASATCHSPAPLPLLALLACGLPSAAASRREPAASPRWRQADALPPLLAALEALRRGPGRADSGAHEHSGNAGSDAAPAVPGRSRCGG